MRPTAKMLADGTVLVLCRGRCGRTLTDPESIARCYGPVCWKKLPAEAQAAIAETLPPKPPATARIPRRRSHRLETRTEAHLTAGQLELTDDPTTTTRPDMDVPSDEVRTHPDQLTDADFHPEPEMTVPRPAGCTPLGTDRGLLIEAAEYVIRHQFAAPSSLQRNIRVGFAKAGHLMNLLEERGIVGAARGSMARDVLVPKERMAQALDAIRAEAGQP